MHSLIPPINSKGSFQVTAEFSNVVKSDQEYTVVSVRRISEIAASGEDPLNLVYLIAGLTVSDYETDNKNNLEIVLLEDSAGKYIYVPANRILSIPKVNGQRYQDKVVVAYIGPTDLDLDLTDFKSDLADFIESKLGIRTVVDTKPASAITLIPYAEHEQIQSERALVTDGIGDSDSYAIKLAKKELEIAEILSINEELKKALLDITNA